MKAEKKECKPVELSMSDTYAYLGSYANGLRCPSCGKYIRDDQIRPGGTIHFRDALVLVGPGCARCRPDD